MLDVLFISELLWCTLWIGQKTVERALLYIGGLVTASYVGTISSAFVTNALLGQHTIAMAWLETQIQTPAEPVGLASSILPPQYTLSGHNLANTHWIAFHIASILLAFCMTVSVFVIFIVMGQLILALWDSGDSTALGIKRFVSNGFGFLAGLYLACFTGFVLIDLSWIRILSPIVPEIVHSDLLSFESSFLSMFAHFVPFWRF